MVKSATIHLNDSDFEEIRDLKDELNLTWEEFVLEGANCLAEG